MPLTRRRFLAATGVTYFLPAFVAARGQDTPRPSEQIRIASIGLGPQGVGNTKVHAKNVVAVCDVDKTRLADGVKLIEAAGAKTPFAAGDYRKILERNDVDAVLIGTPDHWHAKICVDAILAGKDVYCEKPLTLTIAEGRVIADAAAKHKRIVQTGSQQRSDERFRRACEYVRSGRLGKIKEVRVGIPQPNWVAKAKTPVADSAPPPELDYEMWIGPAPMRPFNKNRVHYLFRFFWDYSGGQVTNFGAHHLDITQWALGMDDSGPTTIEGKASYHKDQWYETPEKCTITYTYASGVKVTCGDGEKGGCTFVGEKGSIFVDRSKITSTPDTILKEELKDTDTRLYVSKNHHANWLECLRTRKAPVCDAEIGHRSATVCHLGNIALRTGRKITWDPVKETIVGDNDAAAMASKPYREPWKL